jgi:hypothetical protein
VSLRALRRIRNTSIPRDHKRGVFCRAGEIGLPGATSLQKHECPDGSTLVVVPWITLREEQGDRRLVQLLLLSSDQTTRHVVLARTTAHNSLHQDEELEKRWIELELCFKPPGGLQDLLNRMAQGYFASEQD